MGLLSYATGTNAFSDKGLDLQEYACINAQIYCNALRWNKCLPVWIIDCCRPCVVLIRSTAVLRDTSVTWLKKPVYVLAFPACPGSGSSLMIVLQWTDTCVTLTPAVRKTTRAASWRTSASGAAVRCQRSDMQIFGCMILNIQYLIGCKCHTWALNDRKWANSDSVIDTILQYFVLLVNLRLYIVSNLF